LTVRLEALYIMPEVSRMGLVSEIVSIVRDIAIVGILVYVVQLMQQQIELLRQERSLKQSEIDVHRANIERLKTLQAPSIARDLEQMTRTADAYADKLRKLEARIAAVKNEDTKLIEAGNLIGIASAGLEAVAVLSAIRERAASFGALAGHDPSPELQCVLNGLDKDLKYLSDIVTQAIDGKKPELKFWRRWMARVNSPAT
jgi:hypothetical protein